MLLVPAFWLTTCARRLAAARWFIGGIGWALLAAYPLLDRTLTPALEGRELWASGEVVGIPRSDGPYTRFLFDVQRLHDGNLEVAGPARIRLSLRAAPTVPRAGERWRFRVRLRAPRGFSNPGGFDYESWLFRQRAGATGYVRPDDGNRRLATAGPVSLHALRQRLVERLHRQLGERPLAGLIVALAAGHRDRIERSAWERLIATGTNHLMAISGLHVGLVAGLGFMAGRRGAALSGRLTSRVPAQQIGAVTGLLVALVYAALAGFSVPTQRALIMLATALCAVLLRREVTPAQWYGVALILVLLWDPLAVLEPGFWLSFGAVGIIAMTVAGLKEPRRNRLLAFVRLQLAISLGLIPLLLIQFSQFSLVGPAANLVAVPVVGLLVTPLTLAGTALDPVWGSLASILLATAHGVLEQVWTLLGWLEGLPYSRWYHHVPPWWALALAGVGALLWLVPRGLPGRGAGLLLFVPAMVVGPAQPGPGEFRFTLLDVGQGMAAVIRTSGHTLLYDTGPRLGPRFDTGSAVILPYLRSEGIRRIDRLIVSHGDNDHIGGSTAVLDQMEVGDVLTSVPERIPGAHPCHEQQRWIWDGVEFRILNPPRGRTGRDNDASCVLRVVSRHGRLLLPGDIEAAAEWRLVERYGDGLAVEVLVAPHHGSRSSSTSRFVAAAGPDIVLFPAGHRNRYGHPHPLVVQRYAATGVTRYGSAADGAVTLWFRGTGIAPARRHRPESRRYWNAR